MKKAKKGKRIQLFEGPIRASIPLMSMQTAAGTVNGAAAGLSISQPSQFLIVSITALKKPNSGDATITFTARIDSDPASHYTATVQCPQGLSVAVPAIFALRSLSNGSHQLKVDEPTGTCSGTFSVAILEFGS